MPEGMPADTFLYAGSFPTAKVNPLAVQVLSDIYHIDASSARSKCFSWPELF